MTINRVNKKVYSDEELIEGLRNGEDAILKFLYENYFGAAKKLVFKANGNEALARDLFQEVIIVIYNKLQDSNFKITSSFFTYFYAVLKYTWLDYRKLNMKNPLNNSLDLNDELNVGVSVKEIEDLALKALRNNLFNKHFNRLSESCRVLLKLLMTDHSAESVAEKLNLKSANYVGKRKYKCFSQLVDMIRRDTLFKELL